MCEDTGIILAYLPPYSPDLDPIEDSHIIITKRHRVLRSGAPRFWVRILNISVSFSYGHVVPSHVTERTFTPRFNDASINRNSFPPEMV